MIRRISFFSLLLVSSLCLAQTTRKSVTTFKLAGPFVVKVPYKVDSVNTKSVGFEDKLLLGDQLSSSLLESGKTWTGAVLPSIKDNYSIGILSFYLDGDSYMEGNLSVKGPKVYKLFVDSKESNGEVLKLNSYRHEVVIKYLAAPAAHDSIQVGFESKLNVSVATSIKSDRLYTTADCLEGLRVQSASVSPNGKYVIVNYSNTEKGGNIRLYSQVKELSSGRILAEKESSANMQWMPHSNGYIYEVQLAGKRCLYRVDPLTGNCLMLAGELPKGSIAMSPTEDYLIISQEEEGTEEQKEIFQVLEPDDRQPGWRSRTFLSKYDLKSGLSYRLTFGSHSTILNDISSDGKSILFTVTRQRLTKRPFELTSLFRMDMATLRVDTILKDTTFVNNFSFSPDNKKLLVFGSGEAFGGIGLNIAPGQTSSMVDGQMFLYDLYTHKVTPLTKNFNPSVNSGCWSRFDGQIYFDAGDKDYVRVYTLNPSTGKIHSIGAVEDVVTNYDVARQASTLVYVGQSASNSVRMYSYNLKKKKSTCLEDCSEAILKDVVLGECKDWNFVSSRGDTIYGRYYLPPHFDETKKYPLIVNYYGGCSPTERTLESRYPMHAYAAQGYVAYVLQPSGATGFGQEFSARHVNSWGQMTADDIIEGTKKFCSEHTFINTKKIGCIGASYGGFMTDYLQTVTDIFAAAVSHAGISDITSYWGGGYWGYSYSEIASANKYPWNARDMYINQSPLFNADKIHTPMLFIQGSEDHNVPLVESIQMFTALKILGRETAFVEVAGQDHQILDYHKRFLWQNTIFAWFAKWLKSDSGWWNALYPPKDL